MPGSDNEKTDSPQHSAATAKQENPQRPAARYLFIPLAILMLIEQYLREAIIVAAVLFSIATLGMGIETGKALPMSTAAAVAVSGITVLIVFVRRATPLRQWGWTTIVVISQTVAITLIAQST